LFFNCSKHFPISLLNQEIHLQFWFPAENFYVTYLFSLDVLQKNAMIGGVLTGALTGALLSAAGHNNKDKIVVDAITGGAIATAAEFLNYLT
jgi:hypothetical protein